MHSMLGDSERTGLLHKRTLSSHLKTKRDSPLNSYLLLPSPNELILSDKTHFANSHSAIWQKSPNMEPCPLPAFKPSDIPEGLAITYAYSCTYPLIYRPAQIITPHSCMLTRVHEHALVTHTHTFPHSHMHAHPTHRYISGSDIRHWEMWIHTNYLWKLIRD